MIITTITDKYFKDNLKLCLENGLSMLIEGIENELDPVLDPVLEKSLIRKGSNY